MKIYKYGSTSLSRLHSCHRDLQLVATQALALGIMDITVVCGHRTKEEQNALYPKFTSVKWPDSNHNSLPSFAMDLSPYHTVYKYRSGHTSGLSFNKSINSLEYSPFLILINSCLYFLSCWTVLCL